MSVDLLKVTDRRRLSSIVQEQLREQAEVRSLSNSISQLLAACQDANATSATFEEILQGDVDLSARLVRMSNSRFYGCKRELMSIGEVVALLEVSQLKYLTFALAGARMFREGDTAAQAREELWHHSLGCAIVAELLAKTAIGVDPEEAFLGGIFHDVGKLFLLDVVPESYGELTQIFRGNALVEEERRVFGVTHEEIGLKSSHTWSFPEAMKAGIGFHHRANEASGYGEFVRVLSAANVLSRFWGVGSVEGAYAEAAEEQIELLKLSEFDQNSLAEQARAKFADAELAMR